jgi:hypothetical protein
MNHILLFSLLLGTVSVTYSMETEENTQKNKTIYALFKTQHTEAKKIVPHNQQELTSLFLYGDQQKDPDFIQWLLTIRKPLFEDPCIQETYKHSSNSAVTLLLVNYISAEKNKRQQEHNTYIKTQSAYIKKCKDEQLAQAYNIPLNQPHDQPDCRCIIS